MLKKPMPIITDQYQGIAAKSIVPEKIYYDYRNENKDQHYSMLSKFKQPRRRAGLEINLPNYSDNLRRLLNSYQQLPLAPMFGANKIVWPPNKNLQTGQLRRSGNDIQQRDNNGQNGISQIGLSNANDQTNIYPSTKVISRRDSDDLAANLLPMLNTAFDFVKMILQN